MRSAAEVFTVTAHLPSVAFYVRGSHLCVARYPKGRAKIVSNFGKSKKKFGKPHPTSKF